MTAPDSITLFTDNLHIATELKCNTQQVSFILKYSISEKLFLFNSVREQLDSNL